MAVVLLIAVTVVVSFHFGTSVCPTHCKAGETCDADDSGCPECNQAYYGRQCQHRLECKLTTRGAGYRGLRSTTTSGITCQRWDSQQPHPHARAGLEENYCRNPDNEHAPWCYTTDPAKRWEQCDVKLCSTQCLSPSLSISGVDVTNPPSDGFAVGFDPIIGCMTGYEASETVNLTCQSNRTWTQSPLPTCSRVQCPTPSLVQNSQVSNPTPPYKYEDQITIVCNTGYTLQGDNSLTCQADKSWNASVPTCNINECPAPASVPNSSMSGSNAKYVYQDTVTITCNTGYTLQGQRTMTCQADKTWTNAPICAINECPAPANVPNSSMSGNKAKYVYRDTVIITCNTGYTLQGQGTMTCQADKTWSNSPTCARPEHHRRRCASGALNNVNECPEPASVPNSSMLGSKAKYVYQDTVTIKCNTGYTLQGQATMTCQADKTWTNAPTCARVQCPSPSLAENSQISNPKPQYKYEDQITIVCNTGYTLQGQSTLTCQADKSWNASIPICNKVKCPQHSMANSKISNSKPEYEYQDTMTVVCDTGYTLQGQSTLTCQADKSWSPSLPTCNINECPSPEPVRNSSISGKKNKYVYKDNVTIVCDVGYTTVGQETIQCQANKTWSTAPKCDKVKCPQPSVKTNSKVSDPKPEYEYQDSITIVCDTGYTLHGENKLTCQADTSWNPSVPGCSYKDCDAPKLKNNSKMVVTKRTFQPGDVVEFLCETGFIIQGPTQLTCLGNKTWDMEPPTCKIAECTLPALPATMKLHNQRHNYFYGDHITFSCTEGHEFHGGNTSDCKATAQWSEPFPFCKRVNCIDPKLSSDVLISSPKNTYSYEDKVSFQCREGFKLSHKNDLVCQANKLWDKEEPFCIEICTGLSTPQWVGIAVGYLASNLLSIFLTVLFVRRFLQKDKKHDTPPTNMINKPNAAFDNYDSIDVNAKDEQHVYNLPE